MHSKNIQVKKIFAEPMKSQVGKIKKNSFCLGKAGFFPKKPVFFLIKNRFLPGQKPVITWEKPGLYLGKTRFLVRKKNIFAEPMKSQVGKIKKNRLRV